MKNLLAADRFQSEISRLAGKISERVDGFNTMALVGIHTRGVPLAQRLARSFYQRGHTVPVGILDINLYRDDLSETADKPILKETKIEFDVNGKVIFLVDDVLYTGRTIRAAMDAIFDLGRPKSLHLVVMARRSGRELPIDTDLLALDVNTQPRDNIKVKFVETDGLDDITLLEAGDY